jgi:large subunit ribosomal protein L21
MYAVIKTGGKQYKVEKNEVLKIEKLDVSTGDHIDFNDVLMVSDGSNLTVGKPFVAGSKVSAEVLGHGRGKKIMVLKFRRRKQYLKRQGHRQDFTQVKITDIAFA